MSLLWKIFGNDEDPKPPNWFMPNKPQWLRTVMWYIRNPLHNFSHYWIGTGNYPSVWEVWRTSRSFNLILPFFSYRGKKFEFYIGWRPKGDGSQIFGIAFRKVKS